MQTTAHCLFVQHSFIPCHLTSPWGEMCTWLRRTCSSLCTSTSPLPKCLLAKNKTLHDVDTLKYHNILTDHIEQNLTFLGLENLTIKKLNQISVKKMPTAHTKPKTSGLDCISGGGFVLIPTSSPPTASRYNPDCPPGLPKSAQNGSGRFPLSLRCTGAWSSSTFVLATYRLSTDQVKVT